MARALTKQHLRDQSVNETLEWLVENYPILELGKRSPRGGRKKLLKGHYYKIKYVNSVGKESERVIEVLKTDRKYVEAYCYLSR